MFKGVQRLKGSSVRRKLPITLDILQRIAGVLDLNTSWDVTFFSACLVAFFGMLRKSSLFAHNIPSAHMCLNNCTLYAWGLQIQMLY